MSQVSYGSQNTRGDKMSTDKSPDAILADPSHIIWKIMLLFVLILGGGSVAGVDVVSISGI